MSFAQKKKKKKEIEEIYVFVPTFSKSAKCISFIA